MAVETKAKMEHKQMKKRNNRPRKPAAKKQENLVKIWTMKELLSEYVRIKDKTFEEKDIKKSMLSLIREEAMKRPDVGEHMKAGKDETGTSGQAV
jgi:hypothetical protein